MIEKAEFVVFGVKREYGGAYKAYSYAKRKRVFTTQPKYENRYREQAVQALG